LTGEFQVFLPIRKYRAGSGPSLEEGRVVVGADTLFGAICWSFSMLYGSDKCGELVERFRVRRPPFLVSSAFPARVADDGVVALMSFPSCGVLRERMSSAGLENVDIKMAQSIEFATRNGLDMVLRGEFDGLEVKDIGALCLAHVDEVESLPRFRVSKSFRNVLDRAVYSSDVFRFSYVELDKGCGLAFWLKLLDKSYEDIVFSAVRLVNEIGLGGERSIGFGSGEGEVRVFSSGGVGFGGEGGWMTLSPYVPTEDELGLLLGGRPLSYVLVERTAFYPFGRFRYFCFGEGSVFPSLDGGDFYGRVVDIRENVVRYGYAFSVRLGGLGLDC
jgi:CRISPR-associated protein Csm4